MAIALITGAGGLVGSDAAELFHEKGFDVVGVDNHLREKFFGPAASTRWRSAELAKLPRYRHLELDVRDKPGLEVFFRDVGAHLKVIVHAAAQPSHDWSATDPETDFSVNAGGTLALLECARKYSPGCPFLFVSTNKVYGDRINAGSFEEAATRFELSGPFAEHGVDESFSVDQCLHSPYGVSKLAADLMVQEFGRYYGLPTAVFRAGCLTGPAHSGAQLHGFLAYLVKCVVEGSPYTVYGYKGKQVRDILHARDLADAFWEVAQKPRVARVYNMGGGRFSNCSVLEALALAGEVAGREPKSSINLHHRIGDHRWWISDTRAFRSDYPAWKPRHGLRHCVEEIASALKRRTP